MPLTRAGAVALFILFGIVILPSTVLFACGASAASPPLLLASGSKLPAAAVFAEAQVPDSYAEPLPSDAVITALRADGFALHAIAPGTELVLQNFPMPGGTAVDLELESFTVLSEGAQLVEAAGESERPIQPERAVFLRGRIAGTAHSSVYLALFEHMAAGIIETAAHPAIPDGRYILAPLEYREGRSNTLILARAAQNGHTWNCSAEETEGYENIARTLIESHQRIRKSSAGSVQSSEMLLTHIAVDCDEAYFADHKNSLSRAVNYALIVMGATSAVYQRDAKVKLEVPYLRVWTANDPYPGSNTSQLLSQLRSHWQAEMSHVGRALTHLFSGHNGIGGRAFINGLCNGGTGFGVSGLNSNVNYPADYAWDTDVTAHELGHNFGSAHTHSCSWNPPIDSCVSAEGNCYSDQDLRNRQGTIMSYCHLTPSGKALYFYPRVSSLIRSNAEASACVRPVQNPDANDMAASGIVVPPPGGGIEPGQEFRPQAEVKNMGSTDQSALSVNFRIMDLNNAVLYSDLRLLPLVKKGAAIRLEFAPFRLDAAGEYFAQVTVETRNDSYLLNNTMLRQFEVAPRAAASIRLLSPDGPEQYEAGQRVSISWEVSNVSQLSADFSPDNGVSWQPIRLGILASDGSMQWTVPPVATTRGRIRLSDINDKNIYDISDTTFSITVSRDVQPVAFIQPEPEESLRLPFLPRVAVRNNGIAREEAVPVWVRMVARESRQLVYSEMALADIPAGAVVAVDLPAPQGLERGQYLVYARTAMPGDQNIGNDSVAQFNFFNEAPAVWPLTPVRGEVYCHGSDVEITWGAAPDVEQIRIEFSYDGGSSFPVVLAESVPAQSGSWTWQVAGNLPETQYAVLRLADVSNPDPLAAGTVNIVVVGGPLIIRQPTGVRACQGATAEFHVEAHGPGLRYQWLFEGQEIPGANEASYRIGLLSPEQAGNYSCRLSADCGEARSSRNARLIVTEAVEITAQPQSQLVSIGGSFTLAVQARGESPRYQWYRNGEALGNARSASFTLTDFSAEQAGSYSCIVTNECNSVESAVAYIGVRSSLRAEPEYLDFGAVQIGTEAALPIVLRNTAATPLQIESITLAGSLPGVYTVESNALPALLQAGESTEISVRFAPTASATFWAGVQIGDGVQGVHTVAVQGRGVGALTTGVEEHGAAAPQLRVHPNPAAGMLHIGVEGMPQARHSALALYDKLGRLLHNIPFSADAAGRANIQWNPPAALPAGVYSLVLTGPDGRVSLPLVLLR